MDGGLGNSEGDGKDGVEGAEEAFGSCSLDSSVEDVEDGTLELEGTRGVETLKGWLDSFETCKEGEVLVVSGKP